ncbi:MAG: ThiF family adenylyltransferase [Patescibacteria group bacterium]
MKQVDNIRVVGIGGVGTHLVPPLCRFLSHQKSTARIMLLDGDTFAPENRSRQQFRGAGNKAEVVATELREEFPTLVIEAKSRYITAENVSAYIPSGSIVFCCVDNNPSKKTISDHCLRLDDACLISGGNGYDDGSVSVHVRRKGKNATPPITHLHPEIERPADKNPSELSCEELARLSSPQLIFANLTVASQMLNAFWLFTEGKVVYSEMYFDLKTGAQRPVMRK